MTEQVPDAEALTAVNAQIAEEFRANDGKAGGVFVGAELWLLTTIGARSGQARLSPLCKLRRR